MEQGPTRIRAPATIVRYEKVRMTVVRGRDTGAFIDVAGQSIRIGTSPDADFVLHDDSISRAHCEIEPTAQGIRVRDLASTNGVHIAGARIFDALVPIHTHVHLGDTELAFVALPDSVERAAVTTDRFGDLLGRSARMRELFADLERIAGVDVTLLVEGETGTGKDVLAESVHRASARAQGPFIVFDCGAVTPSLAESELFGHERGAFTGASSTREGVFELANGGTLFLDELGELPKELQPKLLRALENRQIRRIGGSKTLPVDVRVIAATNKNLRAAVANGEFREDLYFRLAAAHVVSPPLRDRMDDLRMLVEHFLSLERPPRTASDIPAHVWDMFMAYRWPGNVRELRNAVQRLLVTPDRPLRDPQSNPSTPPPSGTPSYPPPAPSGEILPLRIARRDASDAFERSYLSAVMTRTQRNVTRAAAIAEVSRQMLQKLLKKHGRDDE